MRWRFGDFELDLDAESLLRDGRAVRIQPQPLRVLAILVEHAGEVVSRDDLRTRIWDTATFVEFDQGLNYCIRQIRLALRDDAAAPLFIETVKKRGYRFIAQAERIDANGPPTPTLANDAAAATGAVPATSGQGLARSRVAIYASLAAVIAVSFGARSLLRPASRGVTYTQITSFSEAAFAPALSPDGRTVAFIVGSDLSFPTSGEIYTKLLPDGDPVQRTHDSWPKYGVAFSPDGSQIAYTYSEPKHGWATATLPVLGGEPRLLLPNAAGLTWLDAHHLLFSEIKTGLHMGLVTATDNRSNVRDIYLPQHERGMAHYGFMSPDHRNVLVVEMGGTGGWERCRLVPFDGSSPGRQVGPDGPCRSAAWSPDGAWMYFTANVKGASHLWRQRVVDGDLEQITSGPAEDNGVAVSPDGRSLLTSVGITESGVWMHAAAGDHLVQSEGYASRVSFSRDGRFLYYLLVRSSDEPNRELWVTDLAAGHSEPVVQGFPITGYDVSSDGKLVVFATQPSQGASQLWVASRERTSGPRMLASSGENNPAFGVGSTVVFRMSEGGKNYLFKMNDDGSERAKVIASPILGLKGVSPDGRWAVAILAVDEVPSTAVFAVPLQGGVMRRICPAECMAKWSPDGGRFYVEPILQGAAESGMAVAVPVPAGASIPDLPATGIRSADDASLLPGSMVVNVSRFDPSHDGSAIAPGPEPGSFAYTRTVSHRNLFRIQLP